MAEFYFSKYNNMYEDLLEVETTSTTSFEVSFNERKNIPWAIKYQQHIFEMMKTQLV